MNAKRPLATINAIVLIIFFLWNYVPLFPILHYSTCNDNQTIELGYCPLNHQKNFISKFNDKPKEQFCCCTLAPQFLAVATQHLNDLQGTFQEIQAKFYNAVNHNKSFDIQETDTLGSLDNPLYLSYQVFLI